MKRRERGAWWELKCLRETITGIEVRGGDASFERELYQAWLKNSDYKKADEYNQGQGFYGDLPSARKPKRVVSKIKHDISNASQNYETSVSHVLPPPVDVILRRSRGRPRKGGSDISRATEWRRKKEKAEQEVLF
jgi:hypothetical protein